MFLAQKKSSSKISKKNRGLKVHPLKEIQGVIWISLALFTFLSLWTYHSGDPSFFSEGMSQVQNLCGVVGAHWADLLLQFFGIASFALVFLFVVSSGWMIEIKKHWASQIALSVVFLLAFSTFLSLYQEQWVYRSISIPTGGLVGDMSSGLSKSVFNEVGSYLLTSSLFLMALIWLTGLQVKACVRYLFKSLVKGAKVFFEEGIRFIKLGVEYIIQGVLFAFHWCLNGVKALWVKTKNLFLLVFQKAREAWQKRKEKKAPLIRHEDQEEKKFWAEKDLVKNTLGANSLETKAELSDPFQESIEDSDRSSQLAFAFRKGGSFFPRVKKSQKNIEKDEFELPALNLLATPKVRKGNIDQAQIRENCEVLEQTLADFNIEGNVTEVRPGPVVTMYEFAPGRGVKISRIANLVDDLSLALSALSVRIVAPIPGKNVVGIEIPNKEREMVFLREILASREFEKASQRLPVAIGKTIDGDVSISDLAKMPHLLVAGATGAGKSVFINTAIVSLLYRFTPEELRMIMVDPKQLELNLYDEIPHLLLPVVTDAKQASMALKWVVNEMERRYLLMSRVGVRNIEGFNEKLEALGSEELKKQIWPELREEDDEDFEERSEMKLQQGKLEMIEDLKEGELEPIPYIVTIIDELADLMIMASKEVENSIQRLAQKARAAGIHLILATQRPSVDVITGTIKANFPCRVAFRVSQRVDSRTILDEIGAEKLLGQGDMLFVPPGAGSPARSHGAFVDEKEVEAVCRFWKEQGNPNYDESILEMASRAYEDEEEGVPSFNIQNSDKLFDKALQVVLQTRSASASMLQRRLQVGYNRAARMVEQMEELGIVGPQDGSKPREVLKSPDEIGL
jgi:S-DNA-T family DNA segregation ATPase FtsK/SpoIIIE